MSDFIRMLRVWISRHPYRVLFALFGLIAGILIAAFGFTKFIGILILTVIMYFIGRFKDSGMNFRNFMKLFSRDRYK